MNKTQEILNKILEEITPSQDDIKEIEEKLGVFKKRINSKIKKLKIEVDLFIGGSYARGTLIKKKKYDIDIFLRFSKKYSEAEIQKLIKKILSSEKNKIVVHGSRDYVQIRVKDNLIFEIIPVIKTLKPEQAENITDLSYMHVDYLKKKVKSKKIAQDILIAKAFCHACNCYGAESYIHGFSGYSLELLVYYYKGFDKFINQVSKIKERQIIDIEKHFKNKQDAMININSSKLNSPIILIDPTYKNRNALAGLSDETFKRFQAHCKKFIKNPSLKLFYEEKVDLSKIKENAEKNKQEFLLIEIKTKRQEGDIAGGKLSKFHRHLEEEISKFFDIKKRGFNYNEKKAARCFYVAKKKKEVVFQGPVVGDKQNISRFRKAHKQISIRKGRLFAIEKVNLSLKEFLSKWIKNNKRKINEMGVSQIIYHH